MLIGYFRRLKPFTPLLLFICGAVLWAEVFLYPQPVFFIEAAKPAPFYQILQPLFVSYPFYSWVAAYLFLYLQALIINQVLTTQGILDKYSFLTSLIYIILMSSSKSMIYMHPVLFSNFFLLIAMLKILRPYDEEKVMLEVFNVGTLIALAGLFYLQAWFFFLLLLITLFIYYLIGLRSFIAACLGFATPFLFYLIVLFLTNRLDSHSIDLPPLYLAWFAATTGEFSGLTTTLVGFIGGLSLLALFHLVFLYLPDKPVRLRKRLWTLVYFFIIALLSYLFVPVFNPYHNGLLFIPLSAVLAGFFHQIDRKVIAEVLFSVMLGLIVAGKIHNLFVS